MTLENHLLGRLRLRQIQAVHRLLPQTLVANLVCSAAVTLWLFDEHSKLLSAWFLAVAALTAFGCIEVRRQRRRLRTTLSERAMRRCVAHASLMAFCFVVTPAWLMTRSENLDATILTCTTMGVMWAGAFVMATVLEAALLFTTISSGLIIIALLYKASTIGDFLLVLLFLSCAYTTLRVARIQSKLFLDGQRQQIELEQQGEVIGLLLKDFEEQTSDWLWCVDAALRFRTPSERFVEAVGRPVRAIIGEPVESVLGDATDANDAARRTLRDLLEERRPFRDFLIFFRANGEPRWWSLSGRPLFDEAGAFDGFRGVCTDVTTTKAAEVRIAHLAHHDMLTDLPNRVFFRDSLDHALKHLGRNKIAIISADLDGFKAVNDRYGHPAGDTLLVEVGRRMREAMAPEDVLARFGGDEFVILDVVLDGAADAEVFARRLIDKLNVPINIMGEQAAIGVSIGIALAPADGTTSDELLGNADAALYRAKAEGRNTVRFFSAEMDRKLRVRQRLVQDLSLAVARDQFVLHFQPFVDARTGSVRGYEALIRWNHPQLGMVPPAEFIPIAEESGLIVPIGSWVVHRACRDAVYWPSDWRIAVNISPVQLRGRDLPQLILAALTASGLSPSRLEIEITETALVEDADAVLDILRQIRAMGVGVALDDFGTGYSSLSYLCRFPFDRIKIDRSFVRDLAERHDSQLVVRAIRDMARGLGMTVTAEGVEIPSQADELRKAGCDELQGYLFGRPMPLCEVPLKKSRVA